MEILFTARLWEWEGKGAWCFISLPEEYYAEIKTISGSPKRGFGSVKIEAIVGDTSWKTSIFPDTRLGTYLLPVKKSIRVAENIAVGDSMVVKIRLIDF